MPSNLLRPFIAQVHRHTLNHVEQYESVHEISENLSLFETLSHEIKLAVKLMQGPTKNGKIWFSTFKKKITF